MVSLALFFTWSQYSSASIGHDSPWWCCTMDDTTLCLDVVSTAGMPIHCRKALREYSCNGKVSLEGIVRVTYQTMIDTYWATTPVQDPLIIQPCTHKKIFLVAYVWMEARRCIEKPSRKRVCHRETIQDPPAFEYPSWVAQCFQRLWAEKHYKVISAPCRLKQYHFQ